MRNRSFFAVLAFVAASALAQSALAGARIVTLSVPGMSCAACPITVRKALEKVPGVTKVKATYEPKEAVVTFDDAKASVEQLQEATRNAGYPSTLK